MQCRDASKQGPEKGLITFRNALWVSASAYALALTYFSPHLAALAWVALIPYFVVIHGSSRVASAGHGALWGAVYFTLFGLIKPGLSPYSFPAFVVIGVISSALLALCLNAISRRLGFNPFALGLVWLIFEVIRIELIPQFGTLSSSQPVDGRLLNMSAFTGLSGLSLLIVVVNVCLILLWRWVRNGWSHRRWRETADVPLIVSPPRFAFARTYEFCHPETRAPPEEVGCSIVVQCRRSNPCGFDGVGLFTLRQKRGGGSHRR